MKRHISTHVIVYVNLIMFILKIVNFRHFNDVSVRVFLLNLKPDPFCFDFYLDNGGKFVGSSYRKYT